MKHGVDFPSGGKTEFECDVVNRREDGEGAVAVRGKFGRRVRGAEVFALEPDKVIDLVGEGFGRGGPLAMGDRLGSKEVGAKGLKGGEAIGDRGDRSDR
jgi:hypothetical protein